MLFCKVYTRSCHSGAYNVILMFSSAGTCFYYADPFVLYSITGYGFGYTFFYAFGSTFCSTFAGFTSIAFYFGLGTYFVLGATTYSFVFLNTGLSLDFSNFILLSIFVFCCPTQSFDPKFAGCLNASHKDQARLMSYSRYPPFFKLGYF